MTRDQCLKIYTALLVAKAEFQRQIKTSPRESPATQRQLDIVLAAIQTLDEATDVSKGFRFADLPGISVAADPEKGIA